MEHKEHKEVKKKRGFSIFRTLLYVLIFLLVFPLFISLLLQIKSVQNFAVDQLTSVLGDRFNGEIVIGDVDFSFRYGLDLNDFQLIGESQDTLIKADKFTLNLTSSLISLYRNELYVNSVSLDSPRIRITRELGESKSDLALVLEKLLKSDPGAEGGDPLALDVKNIKVHGLDLGITDLQAGQIMSFTLLDGHIIINEITPEVLDIDMLRLIEPAVIIKRDKGGKTITSTKNIDTAGVESEQQVIKLATLEIVEGQVKYNDERRSRRVGKELFDYNHFFVDDIYVEANNLLINGSQDIKADIKNLSLDTDSGFTLKSLISPDFTLNEQGLSLAELYLETGETLLRDNISFQFDDFSAFKDFNNKVKMYGRLRNSHVALKELRYFVHSLERIDFFRKNSDRRVYISGQIAGTVNQLSSDNIQLSIPGEAFLKGKFSSSNLAVKGSEILDFSIDSLQTSIRALERLISQFKPSAQLRELGDIYFKGDYKGSLKAFNAAGTMRSDLGQARMNIDMNLGASKASARYSGNLVLDRFDLGRLLGNKDVGSITIASTITEGRGLTPETAHARLDAVVEQFYFKDYEYNDFKVDGLFDKNRFRGLFDITDEDIDLTFNGVVEVEDGLPYFAFDANVKKLDLFQLNIMKKPFAVEGIFHINMEGADIDDMVGEFYGNDLRILTNDTIYGLDTLKAEVLLLGPDRKSLELSSEVFDINIEGDYRLKTLVPTIRHYLKSEYELFLEHWPENTVDTSRQIVSMDVRIEDSKNLFELIGVKDLSLTDVDMQAEINTDEEFIEIEGALPSLKIGKTSLLNSSMSIFQRGDLAEANITIDSSDIEGFNFNPIDISMSLDDEDLNFSITTSEVVDSIERLNLMFTLSPVDGGYDVTFDNDRMTFLGENWDFHPKNRLFIGEEYLEIENLILSDGNRRIVVDEQVNNRGINVSFEAFDLNIINPILKEKKLIFSGPGNFNVFVADIFNKSTGIMADVSVPDFRINGDEYGGLDLLVNRPTGQAMDINFKVLDEDFSVNLLAEYNLEEKTVIADITSRNFPLKFFEFIIVNGIRDTEGGIDVKGKITGPLNTMKIDAIAKVYDAATTVIYTGSTFYSDDQEVIITERIIDATGVELTDINGSNGSITGGLHHDYFTDFLLDVTIAGEDVVALSTTKKDNPLYYGIGRGDMSAQFTGPFEKANIKINAVAGRGSELNIPIQSTQGDINENFITFIERDALVENADQLSREVKIEGVDLEMDLTLTPEAKVNLIFDESRGDIIEGLGRGGLKIYVTRAGDFDVYGDYEIESGKYLFTAFGLVAKPFTVRRGGLVRWTGDPINASLNIEADYSLRAPLNIFLNEYLTTPQQINEAGNKTDVNLKMILTNKLFNPTVNFDLEFPNLAGELRSIADSKMRILKSNQNELNNQVLGLIVFNSFLPSSSLRDVAGADISSAGISTLSEFVSSQLSILFTGLINEALTENGLVSGIDFDIGIRKNSFYGVSNVSNDLLPDEIEVNLKNRFRFLDERLSLDLGGNYVRAPIRNIQEYFIGDFVVEYFLTDDRKLKLRMYGRYDYDEAVADRKLKYGLGLGYRTEFGKLSEFKNRIAQSIGESQPEN